MDAPIALEFLHRARHTGEFIPYIELNNFIARHIAGISDLEGDIHGLSTRSLLPVDGQVAILEGRVTQSVPKRI